MGQKITRQQDALSATAFASSFTSNQEEGFYLLEARDPVLVDTLIKDAIIEEEIVGSTIEDDKTKNGLVEGVIPENVILETVNPGEVEVESKEVQCSLSGIDIVLMNDLLKQEKLMKEQLSRIAKSMEQKNSSLRLKNKKLSELKSFLKWNIFNHIGAVLSITNIIAVVCAVRFSNIYLIPIPVIVNICLALKLKFIQDELNKVLDKK